LTLPWALDAATRQHTLAGVHPDALEPFRALLAEAETMGFRPYLSSVHRTCAEQSATAGSSAGGGCSSWHAFGRAVDVDLGGDATLADYEALAETWELGGGVWGGRWKEQYPPDGDFKHYQWTPGLPDAVPDSWCPPELRTSAWTKAITPSHCDAHVRKRWPTTERPKAFRPGSRALVIGGMVAAVTGGVTIGSVIYRRSKVPAFLLGAGLLSMAIGAVRR
jgi:hypothetical protein